MTDDNKRKLQDRIAALHEKYCKQLPGKYQEINDSWTEYQTDLTNVDFIETFYRHIHTLKGTAATFGFNAQADTCFEIQKLLLTVENDHSILPDSSIVLIQKYLEELKANINTPADKVPD